MSQPTKNICVVSDSFGSFIKSHITHLPAKVLNVSMFPFIPDTEIKKEAQTGSEKIKHSLKSAFRRFENKRKEAAFRRFITQNNIGLILAEYGVVGVAVLDLCKKYNLPLVVHFHGYDAYKKNVLSKLGTRYKEMFSYAKAVIAVSRDMEQQLLKLGADRAKLHYNVYGVDVNLFKSSDVLNSKQQFLAVGRFVEKKAPHLLILSFHKMLSSVPAAKLVFVGDGALMDICRQLVSSLKISENVSFLGELPQPEISELMRTSRAFVQHSIVPASGDSEGTPVAILEAQTCGLPVISTKHAGIKDVIFHGQTGYLVDEGDIDSMAKYMADLMLDPQLAAQLGQNARKNALENFTMKKSISGLRQILEKIN